MVNHERAVLIHQHIAAPHHAAEFQAQGFTFHSAEEAVFRFLQPIHLHQAELLAGVAGQIQRVAKLQHRAVAHDHHTRKMVFLPVECQARQHFAVLGCVEFNFKCQAYLILLYAGAEIIHQANPLFLQFGDETLEDQVVEHISLVHGGVEDPQ